MPRSAAYHGFVNWFLYAITPKLTGVWRSEIFWDPYGLATGNADNYHEITLGLLYKPKDHIWIRPEVRYDWSQFTHPYNDGTREQPVDDGLRCHLPLLMGGNRAVRSPVECAGPDGPARPGGRGR